MSAMMKSKYPQSDGYYRVQCPRYKMPAFARVRMSGAGAAQVKVCSARTMRCDEACLDSAVLVK